MPLGASRNARRGSESQPSMPTSRSTASDGAAIAIARSAVPRSARRPATSMNSRSARSRQIGPSQRSSMTAATVAAVSTSSSPVSRIMRSGPTSGCREIAAAADRGELAVGAGAARAASSRSSSSTPSSRAFIAASSIALVGRDDRALDEDVPLRREALRVRRAGLRGQLAEVCADVREMLDARLAHRIVAVLELQQRRDERAALEVVALEPLREDVEDRQQPLRR